MENNQTIISNICPSHPGEVIQMYCSDCLQQVCLTYIADTHRGHHFDKAADFISKKLLEIGLKVKENISSFTIAMKAVDANIENYDGQNKALSDKVNYRRKELKTQIDVIADDILNELNSTAQKDLKELFERKAGLTKDKSELQQFLESIQDKSGSADSESIQNIVKEYEQKTQNPRELQMVNFTHGFNDGKIDTTKLKDAFGQLCTVELKSLTGCHDSDDKDVNASDENTDRILEGTSSMVDPQTVAGFKPGIRYNRVTAIGKDKAWVGDRFQAKMELYLVDKAGRFLNRGNLGFTIGDITTPLGELLVTDTDNCQVKKLTKDDKFVKIMDTLPDTPSGLCTTTNNEILVCLNKYIRKGRPDEHASKILRITESGQVNQTIRADQTGETFHEPVLVAENVNGDICLADRSFYPREVSCVVLNKDGQLRFRYSPKTNPIKDIYGIVCDKLGFILLSDYENHRIHMINMNGKFIQYVLMEEHGLQNPLGMSINCKGELWVCHKKGEVVRVIKYRSQ